MSREVRNNSIIAQFINLNEEMMTVEKVAEILCISKWGVLKQIERGVITAHKHGRRWYIMKSELMQQLRNQ